MLAKEIETKCLKTLEKTLLSEYRPSDFRINGYKEEAVCLNKKDNQWIVSLYERGNNDVVGSYRSILDACSAFIDELGGGDTADILKDRFLMTID